MSNIIIIGASTRAAAISARRAGWTPWCADLFADADLERIATVHKVSAESYPHGLLDALQEAPDAPVMYTGGLENRPELIAKIDRPLLGNPPSVLRAVRAPKRWTACLTERGLPCPALTDKPATGGPWLLKPKRSAGGVGIRAFDGQAFNPRTHFLQERLDGIPCSAIFLAREEKAIFLGATNQLIGVSWLNAAGFQYAGSIGPLLCDEKATRTWHDIGNALALTFRLRGIFGVDAILRDGVPFPVEINPRYTASVEIIERYWHRGVLNPADGVPRLGRRAGKHGVFWGKAILFARATFAFPADGPWRAALADGADLDETEYADIPHAGEIIEKGRPVLTLFASGVTVAECEKNLQEKAHALDRRLWGQ